MGEGMNVSDNEAPGATVLKKAAGAEEAARPPPLALSEKNNAVPVPVSRKPRTKEVASRYKVGINPITIPPRSTMAATRRCPSPGAERVSPSPPSSSRKRSQSAEKRRPTTTPTPRSSAPSSPLSSRSPGSSSPSSRPSTPVHDAGPADMLLSSRRFSGGRAPDGLWPSMRNLSSSLLPESASAPLTMRGKPTERRPTFISDPSSRPATAALEEKTAPSRWKNPSDRLEILKHAANQHRWPAASNGKFSSRATARCMESIARAVGVYGSPASRGVSPTRRVHISDGSRKGALQQNANGLTRRASLDGSGRLDHELSSAAGASANVLERTPSWSHPSRTLSVHRARPSRPSSPIKASLPSISTSRGVASPSRARPSTPTSPSTPVGRVGMSSSVPSFNVNLQKGKKGSSQIEDAHHLRLLHNRYLQWRFVNARADSATSVQTIKAEVILHRTWVAISMMCDSVVSKRSSMQKLKLVMKLLFMLGDQMTSLEKWALMEREHSSSLSGATEALKARTLKLPVTRGAKVESYSLKDAVSTAVDIMQAMTSFISQLLPRVEAINSLACELAVVAACESAMLGECRELLTSTAAMQVMNLEPFFRECGFSRIPVRGRPIFVM